MRQIYLDYNATTPVAPSAVEAMLPFYSEHFGLPGASHFRGRGAQEAIEDARERVATLIGAERQDIVFTSGGTESVNLAIKGIFFRRGLPQGRLVISAIEHGAVRGVARFLRRLGVEVAVVRCQGDGRIDPDAVAEAIIPGVRLVSIILAQHETGVIQPISEIAHRCRQRDVPVHVDAVQACGKIDVDVERLGVDLLSLSAHKLYGPKGVGALYIRRGLVLEPLHHGEENENGLRGGSECVASIVALGHAAHLAARCQSEAYMRLVNLRDRLARRLRETIGNLLMFGEHAPRLPNTLCAAFPGIRADELLRRTPEVQATACETAWGADGNGSALAAMGVPSSLIQSAVRLSLGWQTSEDEVERAANSLLAAWQQLA